MTTNKPEVVIWTNEGNLRRVREMPHTGGKAKIKGREEQGFHVGLIRLSDYEALQAECRILESELATVKKVAYGNVDLLDECEKLRVECVRLVEALERSVAGFDALSGMVSLDAGARNYARQKTLELNAVIAAHRKQ